MGMSKMFQTNETKTDIVLKIVSQGQSVVISLDDTKELSDFLSIYHLNNQTENKNNKNFSWNITTR